jgi:hypothetical protein
MKWTTELAFTLYGIATPPIEILHTYRFSSELSPELPSELSSSLPFPFLPTNHHVTPIIPTAPTNNPILVA